MTQPEQIDGRTARRPFSAGRLRHLTWGIGALSLILVGQFNEFSFAYFDDGRLVSRLALALCVLVLALGVRSLARVRVGLPMALLSLTLIYTLGVGLLVGAVNAPLADVWSDSGRLTKGIFTLVCVFVAAQALIRAGKIVVVMNVTTIVAALVVAVPIVSFILGLPTSIHEEVVKKSEFRYSGVFGNPNQAAMFCSLMLCASLMSTFRPIAKIALATLALAGVIATLSRGGLLTFAAVLAANALVGAGWGRFGAMLAFGSCGVIVFAAVPWIVEAGVLPHRAAYRVLGLYDLLTGAASLADNSRGQLLVGALRAIGEHPIAGLGFGDYTGTLGLGTHNMYTHFAMLAGVPAALLYIGSILALGVCASRLKRETERRFCISMAVWMATMGLSSHNLFDERYSIMFLAIACALVAAQHARPRVRSEGCNVEQQLCSEHARR